MTYAPKNIYGAVPTTTRAKPLHVGGDPKGNNWLYSCGQSVFIRNLKDPLKVELYSEHQFPPTVARYAPSGFYIASGDNSGTIRIWDTTQKEHILKYEYRVLAGPILDLQWSDDSKRIVAVGEGKEKFGVTIMWDTGASVGEITGHAKAIQSADFKQTRPYRVATGSEDFQVNWFEGPPFKFKKAYKEHTRFVNCVRFSPDGSKLVTVSSDKQGFFYGGKDGELLGSFSANNAHTAGIYSASWSPDSQQVLTASADKTCKIWNANTFECVKTFTFSENLEDQQLGCLWQGDELISISFGGDIYYLDPSNPSVPKRVVKGHNKFITSLAYEHSTSTLYSGDFSGLILAWDVSTGNSKGFSGKGHSNQINKIIPRDGHLITAAKDDSIRITKIVGAQYGGESISLDSEPVDLAVGHKDVHLVITVNTDSIVLIRSGKIVSKHPVKFQPTAVALSIDEIQVAVGGKDNQIHFYSLSGDKLTEGAVLSGHRGPLSSLSYSPDGHYLASADTNRDIFVWELASNKQKVTGWQYHTARINSLAWAPDSIHLATASLDGTVIVWNQEETGKRIHIKDAHRGGVNTVLWIDGNTVASSGQDSTIKTWNITF